MNGPIISTLMLLCMVVNRRMDIRDESKEVDNKDFAYDHEDDSYHYVRTAYNYFACHNMHTPPYWCVNQYSRV